jgi:hypothetical protein
VREDATAQAARDLSFLAERQENAGKQHPFIKNFVPSQQDTV